MTYSMRNRACHCARCKLADLIGPAVLVTVGTLLLLDNLNVRGFHSTWPIILIVIGSIRVLQSSASTAGHIEPGQSAPPSSSTGISEEAHHG